MVGIIIGTGIRIRFLGKTLDARGRDRLVGAMLIAVALASTAQSLVFQRQQRGITDCQTRYNQRFQISLQERSKNADRDRANTNKMVKDVLSARPGTDEGRKALEHYIQENERLQKERRGIPLPAETGANCERGD